jgi:hypothetical protein
LKIDNEINGTDAGQAASANPTNPNAMDILAVNARLSETNRTRMMRQGLCFRCGEHGHISRECPTKPKNPKGTPKGPGKGKEKVWIDALEEEVRRLTERLKGEGNGGNASNSKNGGAQA